MPNELIFYRTQDGKQRIQVVYRDENFWMTQKALAEDSVCSILEPTADDGKRWVTK